MPDPCYRGLQPRWRLWEVLLLIRLLLIVSAGLLVVGLIEAMR
jgi:hypothetical protein